MKICTQTSNVFERIDTETAIRWFAEAGFDALDYSMFFLNSEAFLRSNDDPMKQAEKVLALSEQYHIPFHQAHAPFPSNIPGNADYNGMIVGRIEQSLEIAGVLGAEHVVVHPFKESAGESAKDANLRFYNSLAETAQKSHVRVALENIWDWDAGANRIIPFGCSRAENLADLYDALDPAVFTGCLDVGHCGLYGESAAEAIRTLGHDRLGALHVHDNDGKSDRHTLPYSVGCTIDWNAVTDALGAIDYAGDFTLEADCFLAHEPPETLPATLRYMAEISRILADRADAARKN